MKPNTYLLLVDDDPVLLRSMAHALGGAGYTVEVAFSAAECLRLAKRRRPDLILLDVVLPDGNGLEVCRWLKEGKDTSSTSVVLISGYQTSSGHQEAGFAAGADAYIVRPIENRDLVARIGALLQVQEAREALREAQSGLTQSAPATHRADDASPISSPQQPAFVPAPAPATSATAKPRGRDPWNRESSQAGRPLENLAGGFAHRFNDLLIEISSHAAQLVGNPRLMPELKQHATGITEAAGRAAPLIQALLQVGDQQEFFPRLFNLNESVEDLRERLRGLLGDGVSLELRLAPSLPGFSGDQGLIEQAIVNLASNARDAMPDGGTLVIQTTVTENAPVVGGRIAETASGAHIRLAVTDSGGGMDPETRRRSFEAFFTTRDPQSHHGLGLFIVEHIVRLHRGLIDVTSELGRGSTFRIHLPVTREDLPGSE
ncbi:MAG: response regulator [Limisphaerales bacterium]